MVLKHTLKRKHLSREVTVVSFGRVAGLGINVRRSLTKKAFGVSDEVKMKTMRRNSYKAEKNRSEYKVVKKCAECERDVSVDFISHQVLEIGGNNEAVKPKNNDHSTHSWILFCFIRFHNDSSLKKTSYCVNIRFFTFTVKHMKHIA